MLLIYWKGSWGSVAAWGQFRNTAYGSYCMAFARPQNLKYVVCKTAWMKWCAPPAEVYHTNKKLMQSNKVSAPLQQKGYELHVSFVFTTIISEGSGNRSAVVSSVRRLHYFLSSWLGRVCGSVNRVHSCPDFSVVLFNMVRCLSWSCSTVAAAACLEVGHTQ